MKVFLSLFLILLAGVGYSQQPATKAVEAVHLTLDARYKEMKSTSQTYKDYKVIKETVLDKEWSITKDSITKNKQQLTAAKNEIARLKEELSTTRKSMENQEASVKDIVYDSTHITVLGVPFSKVLFILLVAVVIGGLVLLVSIAFARVKIANGLMKEKALVADSIAHEFEDFKKRSMEKQTKLSRELQNERNKWQEHRKL